jgi:hypothetical protein
MESDVLSTLPKVDTAVHCSECGEKHFWTREHAYVAGERRRRAQAHAPVMNILE